ncbi:MAG: EamA family transporter [Acidobacteriales bacterium]|nr:EamA family transporter [Terriglobales bacterium]
MTPFLRRHRIRILIAFAMLYVLWGSTFMAIAVAVRHMSPLVMGSTRFVAAGALMLAWCAWTGRKVLPATSGELLRLGVIGVLLLTGGNVVVGWSEKYISSGVAALLLCATPIWVALIEAWILKSDRLSGRGVFGLGLGTVGMVVLLWPKLQATSALGRMELWASLALFGASLSWVTGSLISKRSKLSIDAFTSTGWQMLLAGLVNTALALGTGAFQHVEWTGSAVGSVAYLVIGGSLLGFTAYIWLLDNVPTAKVATYAYVNPIVAVFLGWLVLGEVVDGYILAGSAVIIAGVILVTTSKVHIAKSPAPARADLPACEAEA